MTGEDNSLVPIVYRGSRSRSDRAAAALCGALLLLLLGGPYVLPPGVWPEGGLFLPALAVAAAASLGFFLRRIVSTALVLTLDATAVRCRRWGREQTIPWDTIHDINVSVGGLRRNQLLLSLFGAEDHPLLRVPTGIFPDGGVALLGQVERRLEPVFKRKSQAFVTGAEHWSLEALADVVRIREGQVLIEYPANRRIAIPFASIDSVQVVPTCLATPGHTPHVRISHTRGVERLPLQVDGLYLLPFVLREVCPCPESFGADATPPEVLEERQRLNTKIRWKMSCRGFAAVALASGLLLGFRIGLVVSQRHQAKTIGTAAAAEVLEKLKGDRLRLHYTAENGTAYEDVVRVMPDLMLRVSRGQFVPIWIHPGAPREYWFEDRRELSARGWLILGSVSVLLALLGLALLVEGFTGVAVLQERLLALETKGPRKT